MNNKIRIQSNAVPPATGTYTHAIRTGDLVFVTGQTGRNPNTSILEEGLEAQTLRVLSNVAGVLEAANCTPGDIVKSILILSDMKDFALVERLYTAWLPNDKAVCNPARTLFQAGLPHEALVMLDVIAVARS